MPRVHTVAFCSPHCTGRLSFDTLGLATAAIRRMYASKWSSLIHMTANYEGSRVVKVKRKKAKGPRRPALALEDVPLIALFDYEFPGHMAARSMT